MKRAIAALLFACMLAGLAGCGGDSGTGQPKETTPQTSPVMGKGSDEISETSTPMPIETTDTDDTFLPLELKEYGYVVSGKYLHFAFTLHNPNKLYAVEFPTVRITARDAEGLVIGTEKKVLSMIYPEQDFSYGGLCFDVDEQPTTVEMEVVVPDDYNIFKVDELDHPTYTTLEILGVNKRERSILGEVSNPNDYDIDQAIVTVIFRDENGKILAGDSTFVEKISSGSSVPFELKSHTDFVTDNFEVYANNWS